VANVNYAALLVVLVVLTFAFPPLVRLAQARGVPASWAVVAAILGAVFVLAWYLVRQRVQRYRDASDKVATIRTQLEAKPSEPEAYFFAGDHLGDLLMLMNRRHEALEVFETYLGLETAQGKSLPALEQRISRLKARLNG
jgi:Na+/melibiose symporter-like transporter